MKELDETIKRLSDKRARLKARYEQQISEPEIMPGTMAYLEGRIDGLGLALEILQSTSEPLQETLRG